VTYDETLTASIPPCERCGIQSQGVVFDPQANVWRAACERCASAWLDLLALAFVLGEIDPVTVDQQARALPVPAWARALAADDSWPLN
jgi:hypothetical protein